MFELEIQQSIQGKPLAIFNSYQFRKYRQNKNETVLVCLNEKTDMCKGRIRIKNCKIINYFDYLCKPDVAGSDVKNSLIIYIIFNKQSKKEGKFNLIILYQSCHLI